MKFQILVLNDTKNNVEGIGFEKGKSSELSKASSQAIYKMQGK
jgi:hypothetical protein